MNRDANAGKSLSMPTCQSDRRRRGSVYLAVLGPAALVTIIGLSALLIARIQLRRARDTSDLAQARLCALSGVDIGLLLIQRNPSDWRGTFAGSGGSLPEMDIGSGTFAPAALGQAAVRAVIWAVVAWPLTMWRLERGLGLPYHRSHDMATLICGVMLLSFFIVASAAVILPYL